MLKKNNVIILIFICIANLHSFANGLYTKNVQISLLTCDPGNDVYSLYGHTAIRIKDTVLGTDYVVNYGIFSMGLDNFVYLFVKGETDYQVDISYFSDFMYEYVSEHRNVFENVLQLPDSNRKMFLEYLEWNLRPENKIYRYKFFSDNCSTRIRNIIEKTASVEWKITASNRVIPPLLCENYSTITNYWKKQTKVSFRQMIHIYQSKMPWLNIGIDAPMAAPADTHLNYRAVMFLPDFLMDAVQNATIDSNGKIIPLSKPVHPLLQYKPQPIDTLSFFLMPTPVAITLFLAFLIVTILGLRKQKLFRAIDVSLLFITGILGCIVYFMAFVSVHESMWPNYNICWAIPLNFIAAIVAIFSKRLLLLYYQGLWVVYGLFFLALAFIPQSIPFIYVMLPLLILLRFLAYNYDVVKQAVLKKN